MDLEEVAKKVTLKDLLLVAAVVVVLAAAGVGRVGLCRCPRKRGSSSVLR